MNFQFYIGFIRCSWDILYYMQIIRVKFSEVLNDWDIKINISFSSKIWLYFRLWRVNRYSPPVRLLRSTFPLYPRTKRRSVLCLVILHFVFHIVFHLIIFDRFTIFWRWSPKRCDSMWNYAVVVSDRRAKLRPTTFSLQY